MDTELTNYDARLEYYLGSNEFVTLAGFYKEIINPIEEISFERGTGRFDSSFFNAPEAELLRCRVRVSHAVRLSRKYKFLQ